MRALSFFCFVFCVTPFAVFAEDIVEDSAEKIAIYAEEGDPLKCKTLLDASQISHCIRSVAIQQQNADFCDYDNNQELALSCRAIIKGNPVLCEEIQDQTIRSFCATALAKKDALATHCYIINHLPNRDRCLRDLVSVHPAEEICEEIQDKSKTTYSECINFVAQSELSIQKCSKIPAKRMQEECVRSIAIHFAEPALCGQIEDEKSSIYFSCILRIAIKNDDAQICGILPKERWGACLKHFEGEEIERDAHWIWWIGGPGLLLVLILSFVLKNKS